MPGLDPTIHVFEIELCQRRGCPPEGRASAAGQRGTADGTRVTVARWHRVMNANGGAQAYSFMFPDDGAIPNNPVFPFLFYPRAFDLSAVRDPGGRIETIIRANGWGKCWRDSIYDFPHYHARIHEALAVARGHASVRFGGEGGEVFALEPGNATVLPAGTGHQCLEASDDFLVVGAYPAEGVYDLCLGSRAEYERATVKIMGVRRPETDPFFGRSGPLLHEWSRHAL